MALPADLPTTLQPTGANMVETSMGVVPVPETVSVGGLSVNPLIQEASAIALVVPNDPSKLRVMLCGTYPIGQSNGYSRVVYYIAKYLGLKEDVQLTIYGFQNYKQTQGAQRSDIPASVIMHDALSQEDPKRHGFGEKEIGHYLRAHPQDIVIIFNDLVITSALTANIVQTLTPEERSRFKLVSYFDQVYPYQRPPYIQLLNDHFDAIVTFTEYWMGVARSLGIRDTMPMYYFPHGFDRTLYYPLPRRIARLFFALEEEAFVVLNLNRNQPRKRWDHTMMAFADVVERHYRLTKSNAAATPPKAAPKPLRLLIATARQGYWDLDEIWAYEMQKRGIPLQESQAYLVSLPNPQQLTDREINILYNACDVGLNTCEGEGFGLCQFEHAALGAPQVCANIGGFKEFLHPQNSTPVEARYTYFIDKQRDGIGGVAEVADTKEIADALWRYYTNPQLVQKHGKTAREEILKHYPWEVMVHHFHRVLHDMRDNVPLRIATPATA